MKKRHYMWMHGTYKWHMSNQNSLLKEDAGVGCNKVCFGSCISLMSIADWGKITPEKHKREREYNGQ